MCSLLNLGAGLGVCEKIGFPPSYSREAIKRLIDVRLMHGGMEDRSMTG